MSNSSSTSPHRIQIASVAFCLVFWLAAGRAEAAIPDPTDVVRGFYATLQGTMRGGPELGPNGRYQRLDPIVRRTFDIALMTRLAVGPSWAALALDQQQQLAGAFDRYVAATYAHRFDSYSGERLEVIGQTASAGDIIVQTRIVKSNGEPVGINYLMRCNGEDWLVSDVYLDGTISELAMHRSEFASILRDRGVTGLIAALNTKSDLLSGIARNAS